MDTVDSTRILLPPPPAGLPRAAYAAADAVIEAAAHAARHWTSSEPGELTPGTPEHARAVMRMFQETFNPYRPAAIEWPVLPQDARARVVNLPIWDIAVQTEGKASRRMLAYARALADPSWRACIEQNAWEESRHRAVLGGLVSAYGIALAPEPPYPEPRDAEWAYLVTGFSECIDSFFAFGLFAMAQRSGLFPAELVETFEPVMQEECRHILLFANWLAAHRRSLGPLSRLWFELRVAAVWVFLVWERTSLARGLGSRDRTPDAADNNFMYSGSKAVTEAQPGIGAILQLCLAENERRFAGYDPRLVRPRLMPAAARFMLRLMRSPVRPPGRRS
ncbi:MAG TPA: hypothetical protein VMB48_16655 [Steroidobacteraceae bacterium]|nr:hypothetical protein [Steroidobacteraceae bacterium]